MKLLVCAVTAATFAFVATAEAGGIFAPNGACILFCDPTPVSTPTPSPSAQSPAAKPAALSRVLRRRDSAKFAPSVAGKRRAWLWLHSRKAGGSRPQYAPPAAKLTAFRPSQPVASPQPAIPGASPVATIEQPAAGVGAPTPATTDALPASNNPPFAASEAAPLDQEPDEAKRMLARAFSEGMQPNAFTAPSPEPSFLDTKKTAAPPEREFTPALTARRSAPVEVTPNGVAVSLWPTSFTGRFGIWLAALFLLSATAFSIAKASGRRQVS